MRHFRDVSFPKSYFVRFSSMSPDVEKQIRDMLDYRHNMAQSQAYKGAASQSRSGKSRSQGQGQRDESPVRCLGCSVMKSMARLRKAPSSGRPQFALRHSKAEGPTGNNPK